MQPVEQLVTIALGVSVFGLVMLALLGRMVRDVAWIQRAMVVLLREQHADVQRALAEVKRLLDAEW